MTPRSWSPLLVLLVVGCTLPASVRYRCEPDGSCALAGLVCAGDGYCYPPSQVDPDGGLISEDGGRPDAGPACQPRDVSALCATVECGTFDDGCGGAVQCARQCPAPQECGVQEPNRCALPRLCLEGWCWEHPLPQGLDVRGVYRADVAHTWFVGDSRLVLFFDGDRSALQAVPGIARDVTFTAVTGRSPRDVFVVGTNAAIAHFDGQQWEAETGNALGVEPLQALVLLPDGGAVAVGARGTLLERVAGAPAAPDIRWQRAAVNTTQDFVEVLLAPDGRPWAVTKDRQLFAPTPTGWDRLPLTDPSSTLGEARAALSWDGGLLLGGTGGTPLRVWPWGALDGGWATIDAGFTVEALTRGPRSTLVIASPHADQLAWFDGQTLDVRSPGLGLQGEVSITVVRERVVLLSGANGFTAEFDFDAATPVRLRSSPPLGSDGNFSGLCGVSGERLFVMSGEARGEVVPSWFERTVGPRGVEWVRRTLPTQPASVDRFTRCFVEPDTGRAFFLTNDGKFVSARPREAPTAEEFTWALGSFWGDYNGAWGLPDAGYAFTKTGGLSAGEVTLSATGATGSFGLSSTSGFEPLRGVWGLDGRSALAVGQNGKVLRYDGVRWVAERNGSADFTQVHGARLVDGSGLYVAPSAGAVGLFIHPAGAPADAGLEMSVVPVFDRRAVASAWVSTDGTVWLAGAAADGGTFVGRQRSRAAPWEEVPAPFSRRVESVFGLDLGDGGTQLWLAGPRGFLLQREE